jgi:hypothetical protein
MADFLVWYNFLFVWSDVMHLIDISVDNILDSDPNVDRKINHDENTRVQTSRQVQTSTIEGLSVRFLIRLDISHTRAVIEVNSSQTRLMIELMVSFPHFIWKLSLL